MWQVLRRHRAFRNILLAQFLSQAGDWLSYIALLALVLELTGRAMHAGLVMLTTSLITLLFTPWAGQAADRWDRRRLMVAADLLRAVLAGSFLFIHDAAQVWLVYLLVALAALANTFFSPCAQAALPRLVPEGDLTKANALCNISNGIITACAAWLGGVVAAYVGRQAAFMADAGSFLVSALVLMSVKADFNAVDEDAAKGTGEQGVTDGSASFKAVLAFLKAFPVPLLKSVLLLTALAGAGGGLLVLFSPLALQVIRGGDMALGALYGSRGLGTVTGALLAGFWATRPDLKAGRRFRMACGALAVCGGLASFLGGMTGLSGACILTLGAFVAYAFSSVLGSALLQELTPNAWLGRLSSLNNAGLTLTALLSTALVAWGVDLQPLLRLSLFLGAVLVLGACVLMKYTEGGEGERS